MSHDSGHSNAKATMFWMQAGRDVEETVVFASQCSWMKVEERLDCRLRKEGVLLQFLWRGRNLARKEGEVAKMLCWLSMKESGERCSNERRSRDRVWINCTWRYGRERKEEGGGWHASNMRHSYSTFKLRRWPPSPAIVNAVNVNRVDGRGCWGKQTSNFPLGHPATGS